MTAARKTDRKYGVPAENVRRYGRRVKLLKTIRGKRDAVLARSGSFGYAVIVAGKALVAFDGLPVLRVVDESLVVEVTK